MSRDIFVQDIPVGVADVDEIPDDWRPGLLPFAYLDVVQAVQELAPDADLSDPEWLRVTAPGVDVEVNLSQEPPLASFAVHVRTADREVADAWIRRLLDRLGARAFDSESGSGIFDG